jgi:ABC-type branched-subunit amino acid transport system substrate-binding protein
MPRLRAAFAAAIGTSVLVAVQATGASTFPVIVVPRGEPLRIAVAAPVSGPLAQFGTAAVNGVTLALEDHPRVRGFPVVKAVFDAPCSLPKDAMAAEAIVGDPGLAGVVGPLCSEPSVTTLPMYEQAGIVVISPTATSLGLGAYAPTTFNRTTVDNDSFDPWYSRVATLPRNVDFRARYEDRFGPAPPDFLVADLAYDAALLLLDSLKRSSTVQGGRLVIDRAALAAAVRATNELQGVTCTISFEPDGDRIHDDISLDRCAED